MNLYTYLFFLNAKSGAISNNISKEFAFQDTRIRKIIKDEIQKSLSTDILSKVFENN